MSFDGDVLLGLAWSQVWQVTVLRIIVGVIARAFCRRRPHLSYRLWLLVVLKCLTPPLWRSPTGVFSWLARNADEPEGAVGPAALGDRLSDSTLLTVAPGPTASAGLVTDPETAGPMRPERNVEERSAGTVSAGAAVLGVWGSGAALLGAFALLQLLCFSRVLRRSAVPADEMLARMAQDLSKTLRLRRSVDLLVASRPVGPLVSGFLRPKIVLPRTLVEGKSPAEVEPILVHELVHVRRSDTLAGALQLLVQVLWWFHPLVWCANRAAGRERERCCDEEVLARFAIDPLGYSRSLLGVLDLKRNLRLAMVVLPDLSPFEVTTRRLEAIVERGRSFRARTPGPYWLILAAAGLAVLPGAAWTLANPQGEPRESQPQEGKQDPPKRAEPLTEDCEKILQEIRALDEAVPTEFRDLKKPLEDIDRNMRACIELCRRFLAACPTVKPACEVKAILARHLLARSSRHREELKRRPDPAAGTGKDAPPVQEAFLLYLEEVKDLAEAAVTDCPDAAPLRAPPAKVLVDVYFELAREDSKRSKKYLEKGRAAAKAFLRAHPQHPLSSSVHLKIIDGLLMEGRYEEAVEYIDGVLLEPSEERNRAILEQKLDDAFTGAGDIERLEEHWRLIRSRYQQKLSELSEGSLKSQLEIQLYVSQFWLGFLCFAAGDVAGTRDAWEKHVEEAGRAANEKLAKGKNLDSDVCNIYLELRTKPLLDFLNNRFGKRPVVDFNLLWATEKRATLRESHGKVFAALFRPPGDKRAPGFLKELDASSRSAGRTASQASPSGFSTGSRIRPRTMRP